MFNSYDSVTPNRRPVIRVTLATLLVAAIFGASASAASVSQVEVAGDSSLELGAAALSAPIDDAPEVDEPEALVEDTVEEVVEAVEPIDLEAMAVLNAQARAQARELEPVEEPADLEALIGSVLIDGAGTAGSLSEALELGSEDEVRGDVTLEVLNDAVTRPSASADIDISAVIDERDAAIAELERQALAVREAQAGAAARAEAEAAEAEAAAAAANANLSLGERAAVLSRELGSPSTESEAQAAWDAGYALGGGSNLSAFHSTILPCESGSQANRDTVVGRTDDWGRAQINRPVWSSTFRSLTGVVFEEGVVQPALNGFMAAHIEQVQGLSAWTCWRNR